MAPSPPASLLLTSSAKTRNCIHKTLESWSHNQTLRSSSNNISHARYQGSALQTHCRTKNDRSSAILSTNRQSPQHDLLQHSWPQQASETLNPKPGLQIESFAWAFFQPNSPSLSLCLSLLDLNLWKLGRQIVTEEENSLVSPYCQSSLMPNHRRLKLRLHGTTRRLRNLASLHKNEHTQKKKIVQTQQQGRSLTESGNCL